MPPRKMDGFLLVARAQQGAGGRSVKGNSQRLWPPSTVLISNGPSNNILHARQANRVTGPAFLVPHSHGGQASDGDDTNHEFAQSW